mmetsp:Transcript_6758/g.19538  ORF Transcript_6758/g.19538 Transcript_6758/m.19538 type:complete len:510 (+) Transcript_6758:146-1675(+)
MTRIKDLIPSGKTKNYQDDKLEVLKQKLAENSLIELKLGFEGDEFRSKRDVESLLRVIKEKFHRRLSLDKSSCLESICIGWRLPRFALGPIFTSVIPALLQEPVRITHLQLILNANPPIPECCLSHIISRQTLESIDLRSIGLRIPMRGTPSARIPLMPMKNLTVRHHNTIKYQRQQRVGIVETSNYKNTPCFKTNIKDESEDSMHWKKGNIVELVRHISPTVKSLKLMDCKITKDHIPKLCGTIRQRLHGLKELSLRQNYLLDGGYQHLFALPGIKILDLSLCDLDANDGHLLARVIEKFENKALEQLSLAGNYRLSTAVPDIVRVAGTRLVAIDCSFCGVNVKSQREIFDFLAAELSLPPSTTSSSSSSSKRNQVCTLKYFRMQGIMKCDIDGLIKCIRHNTSLRYLAVNNRSNEFPISIEAMRKIASALEWNYCLETLRFDAMHRDYLHMEKDIEFWLELNRCGRRALLQTNDGVSSWSNIIGLGARNNDPNILFWLLKHGSVMFT